MRGRLPIHTRLSAILTAAAVAPLCAATPAIAGDSGPRQPVIVVMKPGVGVSGATQRRERKLGFEAAHVFHHAVHGFSARLDAGQIAELRRDSAVAMVAPDLPVEATAAVAVTPGDLLPTGVERLSPGAPPTVREASTAAVAVIDTGIQLSHPDLNAISGTDCVTPGTPADNLDNGHGTHVAGIVGARNDGAGVVGTAPGTQIVAVRVLGSDGSGFTSGVICGLDWVTANAAALGISVANMSLGGPGASDQACGSTNKDPLHAAVCRTTAAGVTIVAAAGNAAAGQSPLRVSQQRPAAYPEVLTVTAVSDSDGLEGGVGGAPSCRSSETDDAPAVFSYYGAATDLKHLIAAPGVCIRSDLPNGTGLLSGTSMAAPHVAGAVALCVGEAGAPGPCAGLAPAAVIALMRRAAEENATVDGGFLGDLNRPVTGKSYGFMVSLLPPPALPACTITGTDAAETLTGTPGDDVICGLGGNDTIVAGAGNDVLIGGDGNDLLTGGANNDLEIGGAGNDSFKEEAAASGADTFKGGIGADTLDYSLRKIAVDVSLDDDTGDDGAAGEGDSAGSDIETLSGSSANDLLTGSLANNTLNGRNGNDVLIGGGGNDTLAGGTGTDTAQGGDGDDKLLEDAATNGADVLGGGPGADTVDYSKRTTAVTVTLGDGPAGNDGAAGEKDDVAAGIETILGGSGADFLTGADLTAEILRGNGGDDHLFGLSGDDTLDGGTGADTMDGGDGTDTCTAPDAGDTVLNCSP